jgi:hypothetical protein
MDVHRARFEVYIGGVAFTVLCLTNPELFDVLEDTDLVSESSQSSKIQFK